MNESLANRLDEVRRDAWLLCDSADLDGLDGAELDDVRRELLAVVKKAITLAEETAAMVEVLRR